MRVLALDLATSTGWACGTAEPGRPVSHGVIRLPKTGDDLGRFGFAWREWLGAAIEDMAPTEIFFESPILPSTAALATVRKLCGLAFMTEVIALDYKVPVREANLFDIRKHFIGVCVAPKTIDKDRRRQWLKDTTVKEARRRGFRVTGDDDADAIALLSFALALHQPGYELRQAERQAA